jgi:hypothetical protein
MQTDGTNPAFCINITDTQFDDFLKQMQIWRGHQLSGFFIPNNLTLQVIHRRFQSSVIQLVVAMRTAPAKEANSA